MICYIRLLFICCFYFSIAGCQDQSRIIPQDEAAARAVAEKFSQGEIVLDCMFRCLGSWPVRSREAKLMYEEGRWIELSRIIIESAIEWNIAYYYLGRSAEGLDFIDAAQIYYKRGLEAPPCEWDNCQGLRFPGAINVRLHNLSAQ